MPFRWSYTLASLTTPEEVRMESINHPAVCHVPWNKGKLVARKHRSSNARSGRSESGFNCSRMRASSRYSTSRSTASSGRAISCDCESAMFAKADALHLGQSLCRERRSGQSSSRSPKRLVCHCRVGFTAPRAGQTITSLQPLARVPAPVHSPIRANSS